MSDYSVNFHIKAIDSLSKLFRGLGRKQNRAKKGFEKIDAAINKNNSSLKRAMVRVRKFDRAINKVAMRGVKGFQQMTNKLGAFGSALIGFVSAQQIGRFFSNIINQASDLNEAVNKSQIVFGGAFNEIEKWAKGADKALGLSEQQALSFGSTMGSIFKNMGYGENATSRLSKGIINLAADVGSFENLSTSNVYEKLRSGLMGEAEPLKQIGIVLNETMVKQKARVMGLISSTKGALSPAMKMQARYALILDQSREKLGDFARTSDALANSKEVLRAQLTNLTTDLGEKLLPMATKFVMWLRNMVTWVDKNRDPLKNWAKLLGVVGGLFIGLIVSVKTILGIMMLWKNKVMIATAAQWLWNAALTLNPIGLVIASITALITGIYLLWKNWDWITEKVGKFWDFLKAFAKYWWDNSPFKWILDVIQDKFPRLYKSLKLFVKITKAIFKSVYKMFYDKVVKPIADKIKWLKDKFSFNSVSDHTVNVTKKEKTVKEDSPGEFPFLKKVLDKRDNQNSLYRFVAPNKEDDLYSLLNRKGLEGDADNVEGGSSVSDRLAGASASGSNSIKNININIQNLVRQLMIEAGSMDIASRKIKEEVTKALLSAVNDVNYQ